MPSVYERGALPHTRGPQRGSRVGGPAPARRSWGPHARLPPPLKLRRGSPKRLRREGCRSVHPNAQEPRVGDPGSQARRARLPLYGAYNENKILVMRRIAVQPPVACQRRFAADRRCRVWPDPIRRCGKNCSRQPERSANPRTICEYASAHTFCSLGSQSDMPRQRRVYEPGLSLHVIQRGNNGGDIFAATADYLRRLTLIGDASRRERVDIHGFVLMTTHFHLLVTTQGEKTLARFMQRVNGQYAQYYNRQHGRIGTVWNGRYRGILIRDERQWLTC